MMKREVYPMSEVLQEKEVATLAGGCFWCLEAVYDQLRGVDDVVSGYAGGRVRNPSYKEVCAGTTGHAEVVQVTFDPADQLPGDPGGVLHHPRPDDAQPPGRGRGHAVPLGDLLSQPGAESDG